MIIDKLLHSDLEEIKRMPQGEVVLPRFKEKYGEGTIKVQGVRMEVYEEIAEFNKKHDGTDKIDERKAEMDLIVHGVVEPDFRDSRLLEKFHVQDPAEIVKAIFLPGEIVKISKKIVELSGIDEEQNSQANIDKEIKN